MTVLAGGVCGLVAVTFHLTIGWCARHLAGRAAALDGWPGAVAVVLVPTTGALLVGIALHWLPAARGSGIPQVKVVYALGGRRQKLRLRDAAAKFVLTIVGVGTGSSLGREGPTVLICSTIANRLGRLFALSDRNQRRLIPVGAAAGIAAAFNAPIAAVTFVIEEVVGALDTTVVGGVVVAAALAAALERSVLGEHPVFIVTGQYGLLHASSLLVFAFMGLCAGAAAHGFARGLLSSRAWFIHRSSIPGFAKPAVGGLVTGLLALMVLRLVGAQGILGGGYSTIGLALAGQLAFGSMAALFAAKAIATVLGYSSGGVGGIFAPTLFVGSMLGGLFGAVDTFVLGHEDTQIGAFALVGMGAFFAGVLRAPMTSILIIFEMTGSYGLILPLMIANPIAFLLARRLQPVGIYEALLEQDGVRLPIGRGAAPTLSRLSVEEAMTQRVVSLPPHATISEAVARIASTGFASYPVVGDDGKVLGVLTETRAARIAAEGRGDELLVDHARIREYLRPLQSLGDALASMQRLGVRQMLVVDERDSTTLRGVLTMSDVMRALLIAESAPESRLSVMRTPLPRDSARGTTG